MTGSEENPFIFQFSHSRKLLSDTKKTPQGRDYHSAKYQAKFLKSFRKGWVGASEKSFLSPKSPPKFSSFLPPSACFHSEFATVWLDGHQRGQSRERGARAKKRLLWLGLRAQATPTRERATPTEARWRQAGRRPTHAEDPEGKVKSVFLGGSLFL